MIYRFFSASNPIEARGLLETILVKRTLRPSRINGFNDPFECKVALDLDASVDAKRTKFFSDNPNATESDFNHWMDNMVSLWWLEQETRSTLLREFGVTCFTEDWNHHLFWSHYASHHTGFCIGFESDVLSEWDAHIAFGNVTYSKDAPICNRFTESDAEIFRKAVFTKADCWAYEREVRMAFSGFDERVMPEGAIREVIIGCRATNELRQFARHATFEGVAFSQASEVLREYRLSRDPFDTKVIASMTSHF